MIGVHECGWVNLDAIESGLGPGKETCNGPGYPLWTETGHDMIVQTGRKSIWDSEGKVYKQLHR